MEVADRSEEGGVRREYDALSVVEKVCTIVGERGTKIAQRQKWFHRIG